MTYSLNEILTKNLPKGKLKATVAGQPTHDPQTYAAYNTAITTFEDKRLDADPAKVGRGLNQSSYRVVPAPTVGRVPEAMAKAYADAGSRVTWPSFDVDDRTSFNIDSFFGITRKRQGVEFHSIDILKSKGNTHTFMARVSQRPDALVPRLLRKYIRSDDVFMLGSFAIDIDSATGDFSLNFDSIELHGVGKKAMRFLEGMTAEGFKISARRVNYGDTRKIEDDSVHRDFVTEMLEELKESDANYVSPNRDISDLWNK